jgi:hypothetical protein
LFTYRRSSNLGGGWLEEKVLEETKDITVLLDDAAVCGSIRGID